MMFNYILRRLLLIPITLFCIIVINFFIINLAPGEPTTVTEISAEGSAARRIDRSTAFSNDERYLHFREHYGLTLPIFFNTWPSIPLHQVQRNVWQLATRKESPSNPTEIKGKEYNDLRILFGDQSRFVMPHILAILQDPIPSLPIKITASQFFVRGAFRPAFLGPNLTEEEKKFNQQTAKNDLLLRTLVIKDHDTTEEITHKVSALTTWYNRNKEIYNFEPSTQDRIIIFFTQTRFYQYMSRVLTLDFGSLRDDPSKTVISEVTKRFKYSLTLAIIPMILTFFLCQFFGFLMALSHNRWPDIACNLIFLVLYATPIFVVAPFLIEKIALHHNFFFSHTPIPISGFTSPERIYAQETSSQRVFDIIQHILLPIIAIMYGSLATQARISRTAILEVMRQDYVRTAQAKGVAPFTILWKHIGRNAGITIVTSIAGSLGIILGGSLIVETLFDINGFGKFFYDGILARDYNVMMFSSLAGSLLTLIGYLVADLAYTFLDPRITLD